MFSDRGKLSNLRLSVLVSLEGQFDILTAPRP